MGEKGGETGGDEDIELLLLFDRWTRPPNDPRSSLWVQEG